MAVHNCKYEARFSKLETSEAVMGTRMDNLAKEISNLTNTLKSFVWISVGAVIGLLGFLISYWVKG